MFMALPPSEDEEEDMVAVVMMMFEVFAIRFFQTTLGWGFGGKTG